MGVAKSYANLNPSDAFSMEIADVAACANMEIAEVAACANMEGMICTCALFISSYNKQASSFRVCTNKLGKATNRAIARGTRYYINLRDKFESD